MKKRLIGCSSGFGSCSFWRFLVRPWRSAKQSPLHARKKFGDLARFRKKELVELRDESFVDVLEVVNNQRLG